MIHAEFKVNTESLEEAIRNFTETAKQFQEKTKNMRSAFCKPGIRVLSKPPAKVVPFDNQFGHERLRKTLYLLTAEDNNTSGYYLNTPKKSLEKCFDVEEAVIIPTEQQ